MCVLLYESIIPATYENTQTTLMFALPHYTVSDCSRPPFLITSSTALASPSSFPPKLAASAAFLLSFASAYGYVVREDGVVEGEGDEGMCSGMEDGVVGGACSVKEDGKVRGVRVYIMEAGVNEGEHSMSKDGTVGGYI